VGHARPRREGDPSPLLSAEVENDWSYASTPPYAFMACTGSLFVNRKVSDDGMLRVIWQFSRSVYCLLFRKDHRISESGSAPVCRWGGAYSSGSVRVNLNRLTSKAIVY
jgi:hypothetical protein